MQTRQRESGSSSGHGKSRKDKIGRYQKTFTCFCQIGLIFLLSCSSTTLRKSPTNLSTQFKKLCLSGEGHGRISFLSGRHRFDYESVTFPEKKEWALAFHYPGIGEKVVRINYGEALKGPYSDDFLDKLMVEMQDKEKAEHYREVLKEFFHRLGLVIQTHQDFLTGDKSIWKCSDEACYFQDIKMIWNFDGGKFYIKFQLSNNYVFHLVGFSKDKYFNRMRIFIQNEKDLGIKRNPLEMMLFLNACYRK